MRSDWGGSFFPIRAVLLAGPVLSPHLSSLHASTGLSPGESLCALLVPYLHGPQLLASDILWFVDNAAAVSALVRSTCSQEDVHGIAQYAQFLLCRHRCRTWFEWIDSRSNLADGLTDEWTMSQDWDVSEYSYPLSLSHQGFLDAVANELPF